MPADPRAIRWFVLLLLLATVALGVHACRVQSQGGDRGASAVDTAHAGPAVPAPGGVTGAGETASLSDDERDALRAAGDTLQAYLRTLAAADFAKADAFWDGGSPAGSGEADLRQLPALPDALRLQLIPAQAPAGNSVQFTIALRVFMGGGTARHYRGWYRLRREAGGEEWKIVAASVEAVRE